MFLAVTDKMWRQGSESRPTFHESGVGPTVVVEICAVDVPQAVISQLWSVAQTL